VVVVAAAGDGLVDGADEEQKKRLREKAQLKTQKLKQEVELQAAAAAAAAANVLVPGPGECFEQWRYCPLCNFLMRLHPAEVSPPPNIFKVKKRPVPSTAQPADLRDSISVVDAKSQ
jgi:hypothetical protein